MTRPAIQLYSLRDLDEPLQDVIRRVADVGFEGIEFATRFEDADVEAVADAIAQTGVEPVGAHIGLDAIEADPAEVARRYSMVGCDRLVIPHLPLAHYRTPDRVRTLARRLDALGARLAEHDAQLVYHNQVHDFLPVVRPGALGRLLTAVNPRAAGNSKPRTAVGLLGDRLYSKYASYPRDVDVERTAFGHLVATTDPETLQFEVDVGSVVAAGYDPREVLEYVGTRAPLVHVKDVAVDGRPGPLSDMESVEPGTGLLDIPAAVEAAEDIGAEWVVYEQDSPADPITTLRNGADALARATGVARLG
ncbi:sugar phosphate isomerase/epimerase family protein [Halomarina litorea]|uniref:sugar phosphate isomerase/epimerase family protein n=1 Tax=Halomarina litorea TaxID=2961595 RepID=UPI0020C50125|nr:sugar phosphate isomerase/epimerase [Halomarina sp. BCD28]